jgi:hypothetical protein
MSRILSTDEKITLCENGCAKPSVEDFGYAQVVDDGTPSSEREAQSVRAVMTTEEIEAERQSLTDRGMYRFEIGDRTGLSGARGHQGCGTAFSVLDWFTDEELHRFHILGLALPSSGELVRDARQRVQERIAKRRGRHVG